jgi:hypothetical protein
MPKPAGKNTEGARETEEQEDREEQEESEENQEDETHASLAQETQNKIRRTEKKLGKKLPENIIGDIETPPDDPEDRKAVAAYRKRVEKKLDAIFDALKPKETPPPAEKPPGETPPQKKEPWYDRPIL